MLDYRLKNTLNIKVGRTSLDAEFEAARHCGLSWDEYLELPGSPRWSGEKLSKADVMVIYECDMMYQAIIEEKRTEDMKRRS